VVSYPLQVEDGRHLREARKLVPDGPGGDRGKVGHQRAQLLVKLQPPELHRNKHQTGSNMLPMWSYT